MQGVGSSTLRRKQPAYLLRGKPLGVLEFLFILRSSFFVLLLAVLVVLSVNQRE
jgi:hypothetical protein